MVERCDFYDYGHNACEVSYEVAVVSFLMFTAEICWSFCLLEFLEALATKASMQDTSAESLSSDVRNAEVLFLLLICLILFAKLLKF